MLQINMLYYYYHKFSCRLLSADFPLLKVLGNALPYEIALGMNGRLWVKGRSTQETIAIINLISNSEYLQSQQIKHVVRQTTDAIAGFS